MSKLFDTYQVSKVISLEKEIIARGYSAVALYYFTESKFKEALTPEAAKKISDAGLYLIAIWENGKPTSSAYFSKEKGALDAEAAIAEAIRLKQPQGTPIYFAVDYDASSGAGLLRYFDEVHFRLKTAGYLTGVYGSGKICRLLKERGVVRYTWLSQSTGFPGYLDWMPHCDILQGLEGNLFTLDIDSDTSSGHGGGWKVP